MAAWILCGILSLTVIVLAIRLYLIKLSAREIKQDLRNKLCEDTNTLLCISSRDKDMRLLAASLNEQLRLLREQQLEYRQGNTRLRDTMTNISHDLRTPLTAICGYLDLLRSEDMSENAGRYLNIIQNRTEAMKDLLEDLFHFIVITDAADAETEIPLEDVNINSILEDSVSSFYVILKDRQIIPDILLPEHKVIRKLNKKALSRIFENILSNAVKYSDGDLRIELTESGKLIFSNQAKALSAVDTGRLFDRYFTVESASASTGIGLSIARHLTLQMGGQIDAKYQEGYLVISLKF